MLGLPLNMDGSEGPRVAGDPRLRPQPRHADRRCRSLFWDERLSTAAVTRTLIDADTSRKRRGEVVDKMAAAYILQGALDRMRRANGALNPPGRGS